MPPPKATLIFPGGPGVHSEACRQSSGVLSAESEFSLQGTTRWADITRVTSVRPARSVTLSSCAILTYRTARGRLMIPRRHRTKNWEAWVSRDSYASAEVSGRFSSSCVSSRGSAHVPCRPPPPRATRLYARNSSGWQLPAPSHSRSRASRRPTTSSTPPVATGRNTPRVSGSRPRLGTHRGRTSGEHIVGNGPDRQRSTATAPA